MSANVYFGLLVIGIVAAVVLAIMNHHNQMRRHEQMNENWERVAEKAESLANKLQDKAQ